MAGSRQGGIKASKTNMKKYGKDYYKTLGAKGGAGGNYSWLKENSANASEIGKIGGAMSHRTWSEEQKKEHSERMKAYWKNK